MRSSLFLSALLSDSSWIPIFGSYFSSDTYPFSIWLTHRHLLSTWNHSFPQCPARIHLPLAQQMTLSCHGTSQFWHYPSPMPSSYSPQTSKQGSAFTFQVSLWFILSTSYLSSVGRGRCSLISLILAFALLSTSVHWSQGNLSTKQMQQCLASA